MNKQMMTMEMIDALEKFAMTAKASVEKQTEGHTTLTIETTGRRFIRVVSISHGSRSVWCFVERATGDIYKAADWSAPAKGVRGNIKTINAEKLDYAGGSFYR
jgi:hypothetical protein